MLYNQPGRNDERGSQLLLGVAKKKKKNEKIKAQEDPQFGAEIEN